MKWKFWPKIGWLLAIPTLVSAVGLYHQLFPTHPLHRRWRDLNPIGVCGRGPDTTVEFGRDGFVRTYRHFGSEIYSKDGHGDPVPYSVSGDVIVYGLPPNLSRREFSITGVSLNQRVIGMKGTEWKNYVFRYEAE